MNIIQVLIPLVVVMTVVTLCMALALRSYRKKLDAECRLLYKRMDELNVLNANYAVAVKARRKLEDDLSNALILNSAYRTAAGQHAHQASTPARVIPIEKRRPTVHDGVNLHRRNNDNPFTQFHDAAAVSVSLFGDSARADVPVPAPRHRSDRLNDRVEPALPTPSATPFPDACDASSPAAPSGTCPMIRTQAEEHAFWLFNMRRVPLTVQVLCAAGMRIQRTQYLFGRTYSEIMQDMVDSGAILSFDEATPP